MKSMYSAINGSPITTLAQEIGTSDTTIAVVDVSAFPAAPNIATIGEDDTCELVLYTGISGSNLTGCTRGFNGTSAKAWAQGTKTYRAFTAYDHNAFVENIKTLDSSKVNTVSGKSLSSNDFTDTLKKKLDGIAEGAQKNPQTLPNPSALTINGQQYDGSTPVEVSISSGGSSASVGTLSGKDILESMTVEEFLTEVRTGESDKLNVSDYIKVYLNGTYHNWGAGKLPSGHPYYSDKGCTQQAGTATSDLTVTYDFASVGHVSVDGATYYVPSWDCVYPILTKGAKYYSDAAHASEVGTTTRSYLCNKIESADDVTFDIDGTVYHANVIDVHNSDLVTVSNAETYFEIASVNPYFRYGDSGDIANGNQHVMMMMRDSLPSGMQMRRFDKIASWEAGEYVGELTSTTTANGSQKAFVFAKDSAVSTPYVCGVFVDGVEVDASNVTISGNNMTVTLSAAPATGSVVTCRYTKNNNAWQNTAFYHSINDPDLGVIAVIKAALDAVDSTGSLSAALFTGSNNNGMRYAGDTRPGTMSGSSAVSWINRGVLFLPLETEVWGSNIYCALKDQWSFLPQLPIFESGRRRSKGLGNKGSRAPWWVGSPNGSATNWCDVISNANPNYNSARYSYGAALGFLLV